MKILVTGAAGFIGSHVCRALLSRGDEVYGLDNFDPFYSRKLKEDNLIWAEEAGPLKFSAGDIRNPKILDNCFISVPGGLDAVIHLAALAGVRPSLADPLRYQDVNLNGTAQVLEAMRRHGVIRLIFASSSSVYGSNSQLPFREDALVDRPISPYAATKKAGELLTHIYHHLYGFSVDCLRFFTAYGPRQRPDLAIRKFAEHIIAGRPVTILGDGSQTRDFTYIDDIVTGILSSLDRLNGYRIFNLARGRSVSVARLVELLGAALGRKPIIERRQPQPGDVEHTQADIDLAARELGYSPSTDLEDGLKFFTAWLKWI